MHQRPRPALLPERWGIGSPRGRVGEGCGAAGGGSGRLGRSPRTFGSVLGTAVAAGNVRRRMGAERCEPRADDDRHVSGSRLPRYSVYLEEVDDRVNTRRAPRLTPRPEADADASRPGDHGAHHKGRTNPIPETRGLRPHYAAEATRVRSSPIELSSAVFLVHPT